MKSTRWTARDFAKVFGILLVVALAASIAVPTVSYNLGISSESGLYRIMGFTVAVITMSGMLMWTLYRREKSPVVLLLGAVVIAVVIVTGIFLLS